MAELLPCPFCGRKNIYLEHKVEVIGILSKHTINAECHCGMKFTKTYTDRQTLNVWNTRTPTETKNDFKE